MTKVILFNKPFGVHSQFKKDNETMPTLLDYFSDKSLRVAGRLDKDSEGLLVLTDNGALNHAITTPTPNAKKLFGKTYLVQVENTPTKAQIKALADGVWLKDGKTLPAIVKHLDEHELPVVLWERNPPIRERKNIPTAWLMMTIFEGKNRQVRRMVAHVGLPCLRLIRYQVGPWSLKLAGIIGVGEYRTLTLSDDQLLKIGVIKHRLQPHLKPSFSNNSEKKATPKIHQAKHR
ncbi:pseudouridine synthase [Moraxella nasovis]|uniref:pseudouridine synthase n=1 Tax=Moraxella nasovis TaxID=2904121 RepID=UPI001F61293C|nr:pseudouridine synthase [Moraxella nasovis]UNU73925.1 pseudouridine synthase [Moraxella nasovis]